MQCDQSTISALDGTQLFLRQWSNENPATRNLVIVHGAGEHSGRYEHLAPRIVARGWNVIAADARGYGRSEGVPAHIGSFGEYLDDLGELLRRCSPDVSRTAFFAHSLGGLIVARLIQTASGPLGSAVVLSSPLFALHLRISAAKRAAGRICSWFSPETRFRTSVRAEQLTRSEWALKRREEDPHAQHSVTAGWFYQILDAARAAWKDAARFNTPILLQQGDADEVVNPQAAIRWWTEIGSADKQLRLLSGHLHELHTEPTHDLTTDYCLDWLETRVPA
jgi:lysophospholipase